MKRAELRRIERLLRRRREALCRTLRGELERFNTADERTVGDWADLVTDTDYGLINSQLAETESRELQRIERALEQLDERRYGQCEECGKPIPLARLRALPYATTCIGCQRLSETGARAQEADEAEHTPFERRSLNSASY